MKKHQPTSRPRTPPWLIRSNSAYESDDRSAAINSLPDGGRRRELLAAGEEELRLREELAREIEKELERELMDGIASLVRRLSDLRARQIVRAVRCPHRTQWGDFVADERACLLRGRNSGSGTKRCTVRERRGGVIKSDAASRTIMVNGGSNGDCKGGVGGLDSQCSDAESRISGLDCGRKN